MRLDVRVQILDYEGRAIEVDGQALDLRAVAINALNTMLPGENPTAEEKLGDFRLSLKIQDGTGQVEITIEDAARIKERVGKIYNALVYGRVWDLLEGKPSTA